MAVGTTVPMIPLSMTGMDECENIVSGRVGHMLISRESLHWHIAQLESILNVRSETVPPHSLRSFVLVTVI